MCRVRRRKSATLRKEVDQQIKDAGMPKCRADRRGRIAAPSPANAVSVKALRLGHCDINTQHIPSAHNGLSRWLNKIGLGKLPGDFSLRLVDASGKSHWPVHWR